MAARLFSFNPGNAEEAARILRACTRLAGEGRRMSAAILESPDATARGVGSAGKAVAGSAAEPASEVAAKRDAIGDLEALGAGEAARVLLSHSAMNRIREVSKEDYLAVVDGGVRFGDFAAAVREAGLFFPHVANDATRATTIAAIVMSGTKFPTEERFGRFREYILSLDLVIPKGEILRAGSRSVKDVTGYDLIGFAVGAGSRCGMIGRLTLRLLPVPFGGAKGTTPAIESNGRCNPSDAAVPGFSAPATSRFDDRAARPAALQRLDERVFDVLDPAGIMKPFPPGVE